MTTSAAATYISRPRLVRRVRAALRRGHVLIVAPPGYGKSVLLREVARELPDAELLVLTPADADEVVLRAKLELLPARAGPLLLDDVHYLTAAPEAWSTITGLLQGGRSRLVLAGRALPPDAAGQGLLLAAGDLTFTATEAGALGLETGAALERAAGWPLALGLLAKRSLEPLPHLSSDDQSLIADLVNDLLTSLPDDLCHFLKISAVPLRFNLDLAEYLLGAPAGELLAEAERRQLFLEPAGDGSLRYHPLVRPELQAALPDQGELQERAIAWWEAQGDIATAIEQALEGGLQERAARLIERIATLFVTRTGRLRTYQRWIDALDDATRARFPLLLTRLGLDYAIFDLYDEARAWLQAGVELAEGRDQHTRARAQLDLAAFLIGYQENAVEALALTTPLLDGPHLPPHLRRSLLKITANALMFRCEYRQAAQFLRAALALPETPDGPSDSVLYQNLFVAALLQGQWGKAEHLLREYERRTSSQAIRRRRVLKSWGWLHEAQGNWDALEHDIVAAHALKAQLEQSGEHSSEWTRLQAILLIGRRQLDAAEALLAADVSPEAEDSHVYWHTYQAWIARRRGQPARALAIADAVLAQAGTVPQARALLAFEGDVAAWEAGLERPLHPETHTLIRLRIRPQLIRLRALLALRCWRAGDNRWRQHLTRALHGLARLEYRLLLTDRDPELGGPFYALALRAGMPGVTTAFRRIGRIDSLLPLVQEPAVAPAAAATLAALGDERAMPYLATALESASNGALKHAFAAALERLEHMPPPVLAVKLLGDFGVTRGGVPIPNDAWERPVVQRLLQYFALARRRPLARDRILEDLWPDSEPRKAATSFRTVYSMLQHVLDPYLPPRARARYFQNNDNVYTFDPLGCVHVDVEEFERTVSSALRRAENADLPPLEEELLHALATYGELLPRLPYAEWLLESRERLNDLYAAGCRQTAEALLARARPAEALPWAERAINAAPWLEEAHQARVRALARTSQRSHALRAVVQAADALRSHLNVDLSPATAWLAERLRRDEEV